MVNNLSGQKIAKFLRDNGFCWHNVKLFLKTFMYFMSLWRKGWRKSYSGVWKFVPKMWDLFPISVSMFVYDKTWDELRIGWKILDRLWRIEPFWYMKNKPDEWQKLVEERKKQC